MGLVECKSYYVIPFQGNNDGNIDNYVAYNWDSGTGNNGSNHGQCDQYA